MASRSICLVCRRRGALAQVVGRCGGRRWLSTESPAEAAASASSPTPAARGQVQASAATAAASRPAHDDNNAQSRRPRRQKAATNSMAIFEEIVRHQRTLDGGGSARDHEPPPGSMGLYEKAGRLQEMLLQQPGGSSSSSSSAACVAFLRDDICPAVRRAADSGEPMPKVLETQVARLLDRVAAEKLADVVGDWGRDDVVGVAEILSLHADFGHRFAQRWGALVLRLLEHLCADGPQLPEADQRRLVADLVDAWKLLSAPKFLAVSLPAPPTPGESSSSSSPTGWHLPSLPASTLRRYGSPSSAPHLAFAALFPQYAPRVLRPFIVPAAVATFLLLAPDNDDMSGPSSSARLSPSVRAAAAHEARPLLDEVAKVLGAVRLDGPALDRAFAPPAEYDAATSRKVEAAGWSSPSLKAYVQARWWQWADRQPEAAARRKVGPAADDHDALLPPELADYPVEPSELVESTSSRHPDKSANSRAGAASRQQDTRLGPPPPQHSVLSARLEQAVALRSGSGVTRLWDEFVGGGSAGKQEQSPQLQQKQQQHQARIFDQFLYAHMALRQADAAVRVFGHMQRVAGVAPTLRTWMAMLEGARKSRNADAVRGVWARMVHSSSSSSSNGSSGEGGGQKLQQQGLKLTEEAWTTRVAALVECGQAGEAVAALGEMAVLWTVAPPSARSPAAVRPTIGPVNAVVHGLLGKGDPDAAKAVLGWAGQRGIRPDVFTFNSLLRYFVRREGMAEEVQKLFDLMAKQGVRADDATFTIILEDVLVQQLAQGGGPRQDVGVDGRPPHAVQVTRRVLALMDALGLGSNMHVYNKLVYLLLHHSPPASATDQRHRQQPGQSASDVTRSPPPGEVAVDAVLAHMTSAGLRPTPHLYTILVGHHLGGGEVEQPGGGGRRRQHASAGPADMAAVDRLISRHGLRSRRDMDRVFWERVAAGYARAGEPDKAWEVYARVVGAAAGDSDGKGSTSSTTTSSSSSSGATETGGGGGSGGGSGDDGAAPPTTATTTTMTTTAGRPAVKSRAFTLGSLDELLVALVRGGRWERAATLVEQTARQHEQSEQRHFRHAFWHSAVDAGLLDAAWLEMRQRGV